MKRRLFAGLTLSLAVFIHIANAGTVYPINLTATGSDPTGNPKQSDTIAGSITTDGKIGTLAASDILTWNLHLVDNLDSADDFTLTPGDSSVVEDTGNALSATASGLFFDYSGSGEFLIQDGAYSGYHYFCLSTGGACLAGETITPYYIYTDGVVLTGASSPVGSQPLGGSGGTVPEPLTYTLLVTGLLGIGIGIGVSRRFAK